MDIPDTLSNLIKQHLDPLPSPMTIANQNEMKLENKRKKLYDEF